jgi:DNA (cytosine-5)-methyltransferase 1
LDLGAERAGFDVVLALDTDAAAVATYRANLGAKANCADVSTYDAHRLPGRIDLLLGGPPCQGFSTAGTKRPDDPRNFLWRNYVEVLRRARPAAFVMENVLGFLQHQLQFTHALREACGDAYAVVFRKANTQFYGVPQHRYRLFVIGIRRDVSRNVPWPQPAVREEWGYRKLHGGMISIQEALEDLGPAGFKTKDSLMEPGVPDHVAVPLEPLHASICAHVPNGGSLKDIPPQHLPGTYSGRDRSGDPGWFWYYRKPLPRLPARTVLASLGPTLATIQAPDVEYRRQRGRFRWVPIAAEEHTDLDGYYTSPIAPRRLTLRECARLQSFPDWFRFHGSLAACHRQVGNAVPPEFARQLCAAIKAVLVGESCGKQGGHVLQPADIRSVHLARQFELEL